MDDVRNYKSIVQQALEGSYLGRRIYTTNAPTSGPIVLHILNILEHYDLIGEGRTPLNIHRLVEAMKCWWRILLTRVRVLNLLYSWFCSEVHDFIAFLQYILMLR